ncbi:MAG: aspartate-semialdehyde dehydrogenase [Gammaproteobacteria bacterium]|nr:aspartate-semialdehyde dehydrogenase [Gammaproteobacteria bacterium]
MTELVNVAVAGATGAVGEAMCEILEQRDFPMGDLRLLASSRSAGKRVWFKDHYIRVECLDEFDFSETQIALFSAGGEVSRVHAPRAAQSGAIVVDNTSHFRTHDTIPLVVPEVNQHRIASGLKTGIIANPNCSTIQMVVALKPIYDAVGIERINVATYQAVSGAGSRGLKELAVQTANILNANEIEPEVAPVQIAFNAIPQIGEFKENGYTLEEMKMVWETQKIFEDPGIKVNPTCVRIPVFFGHSEAVHIETREPLSVEDAHQLLRQAKNVELIDERTEGGYPTAVLHAAGKDPVYVGRVRKDISHDRGLSMWIVSDNVRKGAALNSIQIAEEVASLIA